MFLKVLLLYLITLVYLEANSCLSCHGGIEDIRHKDSKMMQAILEIADKSGNGGNDCIVCHGGNPKEKKKELSHAGTVEYFLKNKGPKEFYPSPTSSSINENTCGMCHQEQVTSQMNSLMMSEAGKIQGTLWSFGGKNGYKHDVATYKTKNPEDPHKRLGTDSYRAYMQKLSALEPQVFPSQMKELPPAPTAKEVQEDPSLAAYTYLRQECLRCHTGGKGKSQRGDYRGLGCATCHIPYSNEGFYEGDDKSIDKTQRGHLLVHAIQSSREAKVKVHEQEYSGVPVETCTTCHNRGKRIGVSYQGLMESAYGSPYQENGDEQTKLHGKHYLHMQEDIHYKKGMLCQDCHTSNDLHGDGFLSGTNLGAVEVECQDCHGTTKAFPWELPLGYSDEFNTTAATGKARGLAQSVAEYLKMGSVSKVGEGYLLTARGNPLVHATKIGEKVKLELASGKEIMLSPLKKLKQDKKLSKEGLVAMDSIAAHTDKLECYTCHATWAPQCYGCHVKIDYSNGAQNPDYLAASHDKDIHGQTGEMRDLRKYLVDGKVTETRSFMRWEDPPLSQNGEGRITPTIPGCQTTITVIGEDGEALLQNHIYKIPNVEGAGEEGQNAIDMSPVQPHTISKESRTCESCHTDTKALGMGISGAKTTASPAPNTFIDLMDAQQNPLPKQMQVQIPGINNLPFDYSKFLDANGTQLQTVGHHFKLSAPLSKEQRDKIDRSGMCFSCHQDIPSGNLAVSALTHMKEMAGIEIDNKMHGGILNKLLNIGAWGQVLAGIIALFVGIFVIYKIRKRRTNRDK